MKDKRGKNVVHLAAYADKVRQVERFLVHGALITERDNDSEPALYYTTSSFKKRATSKLASTVCGIALIIVLLFVMIITIDQVHGGVGAKRVAFHYIFTSRIACDLSQPLLINCLAGLFLLYKAEYTFIQMLIEILNIVKSGRADRAVTSYIVKIAQKLLLRVNGRLPLPCIR